MLVFREVLGVVIITAIGLACTYLSIKNGKEWREGKGKPILANRSSKDLAKVAVAWPLRSARWPPPAKEMDVHTAATYARLAERAARAQRILAEITIVVGAAWLGLTLPHIWNDYTTSRNAALTGRRSLVDGFLFSRSQLVHFLPVLVIAVGVVFRITTIAYETARAAYEGAADRRPETIESTAESQEEGLIRRIKRRLAL